MKDKWGDIPLLYSLWCNAPDDIVSFLVESYKSIYPEYVFDWPDMAVKLCWGCVPSGIIRRLVSTQKKSFPSQKYDMKELVMHVLEIDSNSPFSGRPCETPNNTFRYLLQVSFSERLELLGVRKWQEELMNEVNQFDHSAGARRGSTLRLYAKLASYELLKESTMLLELALWKAKIDEYANSGAGDEVRGQCRINCGADVIIRSVLAYLLPEPRVSSFPFHTSSSVRMVDVNWLEVERQIAGSD